MRQFPFSFFPILLVVALCVPFMSGCGPDDSDVNAPALTLDSLQEQNDNTTGTTAFKVGDGTSLDLSGTVEVGALVEVELNAADPVVATVTEGTWNYLLEGSSLVEGSNTVVVSAEDSVGNKRSLTFFVTRDTTGPAITFDQYLTPDRDGTQTIGGTVDVGSSVNVQVFDADGLLVLNADADVEGNLWYYDLDLSSLADGGYDVSVIGYDELGNPSSEVVEPISVDGAAPLLSVDQSSLAWATSTGVTVTGAVASGLEPIFTPIETTATIENQLVDGTTDPDSWSADFVELEAGVNLLSIVVDDGSVSAEAQVMAYRDTAAPAVIANSPAHGAALDVAPSGTTVTFSEDMDAASIETTDVATAESPSMTVVDSAGELVDGDITYDAASRTATYASDPLVSGQSYTVTVDSSARDALGNPLGSDYAWRFKLN